MKKAERVDGFVLRFYNSFESEERVVIEINVELDQVDGVNLEEKMQNEVIIINKHVNVNLRKNQDTTILF
ncbi:glycosyl hydrolase-related protein [Bacillus sp. AL-1R]